MSTDGTRLSYGYGPEDSLIKRIKRILFGAPLSNQMMAHERITKVKALAILSSDALSSVAYATEEVLIPLSAFALAAVAWSIPIALAIAGLLLIVTLSYRQTIDAYPSGGGAYIVAKENLGITPGLVAASALLIDYVLTVAVSVAAGVENISSAIPALREHKEALGILVIFVLMLINLRGVRESSNIFAAPTYLFIFSFVIMILAGIYQSFTGQITDPAPIVHEVYPTLPLFLILRAFASGCSALTGVEAISNGIPIFKEPTQRNAKTTLVWMSLILGSFFLGITILAHIFKIVPKEGETAVSLLSHSVFGNSVFYYVIQISTALILVLAANTSYADFPRLSSLLARDRYLPRQLASLGDRLVFSNGIFGLSFAAMFLIILFKGDTHHLIPLYAVGVFLSFTLSQAGMVIHHLRIKEKGWKIGLTYNLLGAITTLLVLSIIAITKFLSGAWMIVLMIPLQVFFFKRINSHYNSVGKELNLQTVVSPDEFTKNHHTVLVPISGIHRGVINALHYAHFISSDVRAVYISLDDHAAERFRKDWEKWGAGTPLEMIRSPYRSVIGPLIAYIDQVLAKNKNDLVTIVIPEFVTKKWWQTFLHNQTALFIRASLIFKQRVVVTSVRYHLKSG